MDPLLQGADDPTAEGQEWEDGEEDYDDEEEYDAEAEEIARRLGDQLWADIAKAQAEAAATTSTPAAAEPSIPPRIRPSSPMTKEPSPKLYEGKKSQNKKQDAALLTVRTILSFAFKDPVVRATLATSIIPAAENASVLDILTRCASSNSISKALARPLSDAVVSLAKSEVLFSSMRNSDAPSIQLDKGKRKRDRVDEGSTDGRYLKKAAIEYPDLPSQISEAVRIITSALSTQPPTNHPPESGVVSSIQYQLHQVFLFAMTSAPRARPEQAHALQELGGMIQMLGILTNIPIGPTPPPWAPTAPVASPPPDIGTAVYPCLIHSCLKTFHRLYSLRTHQRAHALVNRPYRCNSCPASFLRNHDLKRHIKLHDKTAWKCSGCGKMFSRRDAIKRHQDTRGRGGKGHADSACASADIEEVEVDKEEGEEDATRRAKLWNGIVANQLANAPVPGAPPEGAGSGVEDERSAEEGEIPLHIIEHAQATVLQLHPIIHARVSNVPPPTPGSVLEIPPHAGHQTLASVIARSQAQYQTPIPPVPPSEAPPPNATVSEDIHDTQPETTVDSSSAGTISLSWLSEEQTKLLEQAIAQAASAAQAQAEAEAALEEEDDDFDDEQFHEA
ncbi:hypothetical protein EW026_g1544 [Hermanssonia centrifuga]|uniref:C2H2-type domain-containing protein n=1 Tax=Hermanssonia centrifuga TaxID=98765 RepID=A0A4V3XB87_9APHY|nr:hypothetical protein EW026_g1544 [Hermanssonia centrifuga]